MRRESAGFKALRRRFWTIDCCELGEIVYENFNAAAAEIRFTGVTAHPMSAKGVLVNPLLMATDFISHFDSQQTPECTEGREGYIWFNGIRAGQNEAVLKANIRDFDKDGFAARKQRIADVAAQIAAQHPTATWSIALKIPTAISAMRLAKTAARST